jgi:hypothetical protein
MQTNFIQTSDDKWQEIADPICLCILPCLADEVAQRLNVTFTTYQGECVATYIQIEQHIVRLKACLNAPEAARHVAVFVLAENSDWSLILAQLCHTLNIKLADLLWQETDMRVTQWRVLCSDKMDNTLVEQYFPDQRRAEQAAGFYREQTAQIVISDMRKK